MSQDSRIGPKEGKLTPKMYLLVDTEGKEPCNQAVLAYLSLTSHMAKESDMDTLPGNITKIASIPTIMESGY